MPIKPENRSRYPADWPAIRARILARAGNRCERCSAPNRDIVYRFDDGGARYVLHDGEAFDAETGEFLGVARITDLPAGRFVRIVLTIAHVHDPSPENCADDNLAAWCQRCHNRHDAPMRAANAAATRRRKSGDLFDSQG